MKIKKLVAGLLVLAALVGMISAAGAAPSSDMKSSGVNVRTWFNMTVRGWINNAFGARYNPYAARFEMTGLSSSRTSVKHSLGLPECAKGHDTLMAFARVKNSKGTTVQYVKLSTTCDHKFNVVDVTLNDAALTKKAGKGGTVDVYVLYSSSWQYVNTWWNTKVK